jgi:serine/threonine-protein kinase
VARGTRVVLFVSNGAPEKTVPSVVGATEAAATSTLQTAGFKVNPEPQTSSTVTSGNVISQSPAANATERKGTTVTIVVASAPATANVPSVTNDPQAGAVSALKSVGFKPSVTTRPVSNSSRAGLVVSQTPPGGSQRTKGSVVTIVVGSYKGSTAATTTTTTTSRSSTTTPTTTTTTTTSTSSSPSTPSPPVGATNTNK